MLEPKLRSPADHRLAEIRNELVRDSDVITVHTDPVGAVTFTGSILARS
ncbi:hypothetical protein [Nocardia amamiensis]